MGFFGDIGLFADAAKLRLKTVEICTDLVERVQNNQSSRKISLHNYLVKYARSIFCPINDGDWPDIFCQIILWQIKMKYTKKGKILDNEDTLIIFQAVVSVLSEKYPYDPFVTLLTNNFKARIKSGEDISKLSESECFIKAQEGNWDYQAGTYNNPTKALRYLDRAIQLNPRKVEAYTGRGLAHQKLNNFGLAIKDFSKAIELEPTVEKYLMRAMCYLQSGQSEKAFYDFDLAIALDPNNLGPYIVRAGVWASLQQFRLAILDYNKIIDLQPDNFEYYVFRGYQYYEVGEFQKAINDYDMAIKLAPNVSKIHEYRRLAYEKSLLSHKFSSNGK